MYKKTIILRQLRSKKRRYQKDSAWILSQLTRILFPKLKFIHSPNNVGSNISISKNIYSKLFFRWKQEFDEKKGDKDHDNSNQTSTNQKIKLSELNSELSLTDEELSLFRWKKQFDEKKNNNKGNPSSNDTQSKETKEHGIVK